MTESLPISAIEHYAYCPRQAALIHVDGVWEANAHTAQGDADHAAVDRGTHPVTRGNVTTWSSLPVWNDELGIHGVCDTVDVVGGVPTPVEYKPTLSTWRRAPAAQQLAAQAMCLETMWGCEITEGVIFTRRDHRRHDIALDGELRDATRHSLDSIRDLISQGRLPAPVRDARCDRCSLRPVCIEDEPSHMADPFIPADEGDW